MGEYMRATTCLSALLVSGCGRGISQDEVEQTRPYETISLNRNYQDVFRCLHKRLGSAETQDRIYPDLGYAELFLAAHQLSEKRYFSHIRLSREADNLTLDRKSTRLNSSH